MVAALCDFFPNRFLKKPHARCYQRLYTAKFLPCHEMIRPAEV